MWSWERTVSVLSGQITALNNRAALLENLPFLIVVRGPTALVSYSDSVIFGHRAKAVRGQNDECFTQVWLLDVSVLQGPNFFFKEDS